MNRFSTLILESAFSAVNAPKASLASWCPRGDSNPHAVKAQASETCVSTNSTTRASSQASERDLIPSGKRRPQAKTANDASAAGRLPTRFGIRNVTQ